MESCAPPASLAQWSTALLVCACLLGVAALGLAPLRPRRWRLRWLGALDLLGALAALGLAVWSFEQRMRVQAQYAVLAARYQDDPQFCMELSFHGETPFAYLGWLRRENLLLAPLQQSAAYTVRVAGAFLLIVSVVALARLLIWRIRDRRRAQAQAAAAGDDDGAGVQVSALSPTAPQMWRLWTDSRRALALGLAVCLALAVVAAGVGAIVRARAATAPAGDNLTMCPKPMTKADYQQLQTVGFSLIPSEDTMPVDERTALAESKAGLGDIYPTHVTCVVVQLAFVDGSSMPTVPHYAIVWVVGYRIPALPASASVAPARMAEWTFVDAQTGEYLDGVFLSTVGG